MFHVLQRGAQVASQINVRVSSLFNGPNGALSSAGVSTGTPPDPRNGLGIALHIAADTSPGSFLNHELSTNITNFSVHATDTIMGGARELIRDPKAFFDKAIKHVTELSITTAAHAATISPAVVARDMPEKQHNPTASVAGKKIVQTPGILER